MRKKIIETFRAQSSAELKNEYQRLVKEIALLQLEKKINPPKETNALFKKRKQLAMLLTVQTEKKIKEGKEK